MELEQVKIDVSRLTLGMYVSKLDCPWINTPFPLQGLFIHNHDDIDRIKAFCEFVYIDVIKGKGLAPGELASLSKTSDPFAKNQWKQPLRKAPLRIRHDYYAEMRAPIDKEMAYAEQVHDDVTQVITVCLQDVRMGKSIDLCAIKQAAELLTEGVIRSPDAFMWLIKLKNISEYSYAHSFRSAVWANVLGRHMGLSHIQLADLALGCLLSDIGKCKLSKKILEKTTPLTDSEMQLVRSHVTHGAQILKGIDGINEHVFSIVINHHERFDGSGYPRSLIRDQIPLLARIAGIVDAYDAMTSQRPYAPLKTPVAAMEELYALRDVQFQSELIEQFILAVGIYPTGSLVELNNHEIGLVVSHDPNNRLRPKVAKLLNAKRTAYSDPPIVDLAKQKKGKRLIEIFRPVSAHDFDLNIPAVHAKLTHRKWSLSNLFSSH